MTRRSHVHHYHFVFIVGLFWASSCFAGGWTLPEGKFYSRFAVNYYTADENFGAGGSRSDFSGNGDFSDLNASLYLEYGVTPDLTLISNLAYKYLQYEDNAIDSKTYGMGDVEIAARYALWRSGGSAFSLQGLVKIPEAYDETERVPLGNGQYDGELRFLFGQSLYPVIRGYVNVEAGYRFRNEEPADEIRYLAEVGMDFTKNSYGRVKLDGILGVGNEGVERDATGNPSTTENYDLGKLDICLGCKLSDVFGIEAGYAPAIYGRNTAAGATWTAAFIFKTR